MNPTWVSGRDTMRVSCAYDVEEQAPDTEPSDSFHRAQTWRTGEYRKVAGISNTVEISYMITRYQDPTTKEIWTETQLSETLAEDYDIVQIDVVVLGNHERAAGRVACEHGRSYEGWSTTTVLAAWSITPGYELTIDQLTDHELEDCKLLIEEEVRGICWS